MRDQRPRFVRPVYPATISRPVLHQAHVLRTKLQLCANLELLAED